MAPTWPDTSHADFEAAVLRVVRSGRLTQGPEVEALEREAAVALDARDRAVVAVSTGCHAIEVALRLLGVEGREVIVPSLTFSGSVLPIIRAGGIPVFCDVDAGTFNLTPETVAPHVTRKTAAVLAVHLHGVPADVRAIQGATRLPVIEDACQAPGAEINGEPVGSLGYAAGFSLNARKTIFAGEGGLVLVSPAALDDARGLRQYAMPRTERGLPTATCADPGGYNLKMPELEAAVARVSLSRLPAANHLAARNARVLTEALADRTQGVWLRAPEVPDGARPAWHKFRVLTSTPEDAARLALKLRTSGVPTSRWQSLPLTQHPAFDAHRGCDAVAADILSRSFLIGTEDRPLAGVSAAEVDRWAEIINDTK